MQFLCHTSHISSVQEPHVLVAVILDGAEMDSSHHYKKFYWTEVVWRTSTKDIQKRQTLLVLGSSWLFSRNWC